jgi:glyceraldehyde-3-phosphate dehydrogenase (NAD(P))
MRDLGRPRADLWEVALWEDAIGVRPDGGEIYLVYHVPNEAIVIPETIDAIRAMSGLEADAARSIAKTDASLGIRRRFVGAARPGAVASSA